MKKWQMNLSAFIVSGLLIADGFYMGYLIAKEKSEEENWHINKLAYDKGVQDGYDAAKMKYKESKDEG